MGINKLEVYIKEANLHVQRLEDVLKRLKNIYPLTQEKLENLSSTELDTLDTLAFRFAKLHY